MCAVQPVQSAMLRGVCMPALTSMHRLHMGTHRRLERLTLPIPPSATWRAPRGFLSGIRPLLAVFILRCQRCEQSAMSDAGSGCRLPILRTFRHEGCEGVKAPLPPLAFLVRRTCAMSAAPCACGRIGTPCGSSGSAEGTMSVLMMPERFRFSVGGRVEGKRNRRAARPDQSARPE